jgi:hypothetical protein
MSKNKIDKPAAKPSKVAKIREDLAQVQVFARTGRLPIVSPHNEYIGPGIPPIKHEGCVLLFTDGVCTLDPKRDAAKIKQFREWLAEGTDPRIVQLGVVEIRPDALTPPVPAWDVTNPDKLPELVELTGLDVERCLRYELQKDEPRAKLVKWLEARLDAEPEADPDSEPVL